MFDTNIICIISIVAEILQKYTNSLLGSVPSTNTGFTLPGSTPFPCARALCFPLKNGRGYIYGYMRDHHLRAGFSSAVTELSVILAVGSTMSSGDAIGCIFVLFVDPLPGVTVQWYSVCIPPSEGGA